MDQQHVLVVGGTGGIGGAISRAFAAADYEVLATGNSAAEVADFEGLGERIRTALLDITQPEQVAAAVQRLTRLDVLVNCAGIILRGGAEYDPAVFAKVLDVNLNGTMRMCMACHPLLVQSRGCIVNTASMLSFFGSPHAPAYSSSKGGVAQLTKSLAMAWAKDGVRVNAVAPGWIDTPLTKPLEIGRAHV